MTTAEKNLIGLIQQILKEDPRIALALAEIVGPPIGLGTSTPHLWEDPGGE